jgi:hypothetical protein
MRLLRKAVPFRNLEEIRLLNRGRSRKRMRLCGVDGSQDVGSNRVRIQNSMNVPSETVSFLNVSKMFLKASHGYSGGLRS